MTWASSNKQVVSFAVPKSTPSGEYLVRVEHIALHSAGSVGGAQFYISCAQVKVCFWDSDWVLGTGLMDGCRLRMVGMGVLGRWWRFRERIVSFLSLV